MPLSRRFSVPALLLAALAICASCQPRDKAETPATSATSVADSLARMATLQRGQHAYLSYCAMCHGDGGNGDGDMAPVIMLKSSTRVARLNDRETMGAMSRTDLIGVINKGGEHTGRSNLMPAWGEKLDPATIDDIADYVATLGDSNPAIPRSTLQHYLAAPAGVPADGRVLFVHHCSACHGALAKGDGPYAAGLWNTNHVRTRDLTDSTYLASRTDRDLFAVISLGGGHFKKAVQMPAWTVTLTPDQIKSVVAYVRAVSRTESRP